jgi:hypothetical protein
MTWREKFLFYLGTGYFPGITLGDWFRILRENRFAISPSCYLRAAAITLFSFPNTLTRWLEEARYRKQWERVEIKPPLFILGHYRSGTTHLHNLLAVDRRFAYLNAFQACYPNTFLLSEQTSAKLFGFFVPDRRPQDNVRLAFDVPYEDEIAMPGMAVSTHYMTFSFPNRSSHYDRFLTFRDATAQEISQWQTSLLRLLKKLTFKYDRPLVLKSPPHTCRIKLLLEMFPNAKFVHIHRDPYVVVQSMMHLIDVTLDWVRLQNSDRIDWTERTLHQWREMHDVYFEQRKLIPAGNLHEIAFTDLERDPIGELKRMYGSLGLPSFEQVAPQMKAYVESIADYKKNKFTELSAELRARITEYCQRGFDEWGYDR